MIAEPVSVAACARRAELEALIAGQPPYREIGTALREIRDEKLYSADYANFDHYCFVRWGWKEGQARNYIRAAMVADEVTAESAPSLTQAAILGRLTPEQRRRIIEQIEAGEGMANTSTREVRRIVAAARRGENPQISTQPLPRDLRVPVLNQKELWACQVRKEFDRQLVRLVKMFEKSNPPIDSILIRRDADGKCCEFDIYQPSGSAQ